MLAPDIYQLACSIMASITIGSIGIHNYLIFRNSRKKYIDLAFFLSCLSLSLFTIASSAVVFLTGHQLPWLLLRIVGLALTVPLFGWFSSQWRSHPTAWISLAAFIAVSANDMLVAMEMLDSLLIAEYVFLFIITIIIQSLRSGVHYRNAINSALHDMTNSFISVFESANDAMLIIQDDRIIICNDAAFSIFKDTRRNIIGKSLHQLAPELQPDGSRSFVTMKEKLDSCRRSKGQFCECRLLRGDMTPFTAEMSFSAIEGQEKESILVVIRDIDHNKKLLQELRQHQEHLQELVTERTEELSLTISRMEKEIADRKQAEDKHSASEQRFQELTNLLPAIVYETDTEGNVTYVNDITYSITGYNREEFQKGIHISRFFSKGDYRRLYYDTMDLLSVGSMPPTEYEIIKNDGSVISVLVSNSIIRDKNKPTGFRGVITDITEMKQVQRQLIDMMNTAKTANRSKSVFLANISHELKTPLNSILGYCRMLEMRRVGEINEKQGEFLACIKESGQHLLVIINELLDISKIQAGKMEFHMEALDLHDLLRGTAITMMPLAAEKHLTVETDIGNDLGTVRGDATRLREVIYNLLTNAVKFTEAGKRIGVKATKDDKTARISVWDEGPGIPREYHQKIFEPFEQIAIDSAVKNQGAGLGLAISNKIIDFHGGTIEITSEVGKGSVFSVTLPLIQ